jgi:long-chain acyl-CoA synthetase
MLGYWNRPEDTAEAVKDGWFHSGDVGRQDEKGYFFIVDRIKDMIAVGGMKVFPSEVERVLLDAPGVADCSVVGCPDPIWGESVVGFVVSDSETDPEGEPIRSYCLEHLASYKVPGQIVFVDELPRNPAGKVLKKVLREHPVDPTLSAPVVVDGVEWKQTEEKPEAALLQALKAAHRSARERMLTEFLQEEIRGLTGADEVPAVDTALLETGMDSVMMITLSTRLQDQLGPNLDLPATLVFDYPRIGDLVSYLIGVLGLGAEKPEPAAPSETKAAPSKSIDEMSEEEAMQALLKELNE